MSEQKKVVIAPPQEMHRIRETLDRKGNVIMRKEEKPKKKQ